jgi:hypothetical protein
VRGTMSNVTVEPRPRGCRSDGSPPRRDRSARRVVTGHGRTVTSPRAPSRGLSLVFGPVPAAILSGPPP